jgi:hypothetical protein
VRKDFENLVARVPLPGSEIYSSKDADYTYRIIAGHDDVWKVMRFLGDTPDYSNFKNTNARTTDQQTKNDAYATVWHKLL